MAEVAPMEIDELTIDAVGGRAIEVAQTLKLFSCLESAKEVAELCQSCGAHPRGLRTLLYLLTSMGLLEQQGKSFVARPGLAQFLLEQWPAKKASLPSPPQWEALEQAVRTGGCVRTPIESESDGGDFFSDIVGTLFHLHWPTARALHSRLAEDVATVLDLGAGSAVWSLGLVTQRDEVSAVAVDHAKVLDDITMGFLAKKGVQDRYELRAGSYFEVELEPARYDLVYLGHIVHSEGPEQSRTLLQRCYQTLKPGGTLVVAEMLGSEPRGKDYTSNLFELNMLMFTERGCVFTKTELEKLTGDCGFDSPEWVDGPGQYPVLLVRKV